jgi:hypothetical protein
MPPAGSPQISCINASAFCLPCISGELHNTATFATQSKHWASKQSRVGYVSSAPTNPGALATTA